ncbi:MAG: hypothetical protein NC122_04775, partial [Faecalibacterium sp.]|nr:hypothetical protein [Faecalibacterium sp.]
RDSKQLGLCRLSLLVVLLEDCFYLPFIENSASGKLHRIINLKIQPLVIFYYADEVFRVAADFIRDLRSSLLTPHS